MNMDNNFLSADQFWHLYQQQDRRRLLYGEWLIETEEEAQLRELAAYYHTICDAYDRRVCSGILLRTGEAMPMTREEVQLVNRHAFAVRTQVMRMAAEYGFTERQVHEAIKRYAR
jgi:hypothetical protein